MIERQARVEVLPQRCCVPLHEKFPQHHVHKEEPEVIPGTCGAVGKRAQVILVWFKAPGVDKASHP